MKLVKKTLLAVACGGSWLVGANAFAAPNLDITATVTATCAFKNPSYSLNLGTSIDPSVNANLVIPTDITYFCTNGTVPATFTVNGNPSGSSVNIVNPATPTPLPVGLTWTTPLNAGAGFATAAFQTVTVTGTVLAAARQAAFAGTYLGSFPLVIAP